jgi:hypothetical protein
MFLGLGAVAEAATIEIQFSGLNLVYDGTNIFDVTSDSGGGGNPAQSDELISMSFYVNDDLVGSVLTDEIFADVLISGVEEIPVDGGSVVSGGGSYFDLLTANSTPGWGLGLNVGTMQVFYSGSEIFIVGGGLASGLFAQDLPFDIEFDPSQDITISFVSAALDNVTDDGEFLTGFNFSGTGNVRGTRLIPEPATAGLALMSACVLAAFLARRR